MDGPKAKKKQDRRDDDEGHLAGEDKLRQSGEGLSGNGILENLLESRRDETLDENIDAPREKQQNQQDFPSRNEGPIFHPTHRGAA